MSSNPGKIPSGLFFCLFKINLNKTASVRVLTNYSFFFSLIPRKYIPSTPIYFHKKEKFMYVCGRNLAAVEGSQSLNGHFTDSPFHNRIIFLLLFF